MASRPESTTIWQANFPDFFHWAEWQDEDSSVLFHQGSGETLQLSPLGAFLLKTVCKEKQSIEGLAALTAESFELPIDKELTDAVRLSMHTFRQKGLVSSSPL